MALHLRSERTGWRTLGESDKRWILRQQRYQCKCGTKLGMRNASFESMFPYDPRYSTDIHDLHAICLRCNKHTNREQEMVIHLREYIGKIESRPNHTV